MKKGFEEVLNYIRQVIDNKEIVKERDLAEWTPSEIFDDNEKYSELLSYLEENDIVSYYDKKLDTYVFNYKN